MELAILFITIIAVAIAVLVGRVSETEHPYPFRKKNNLFSNAERQFLTLIERAVGDDYKIVSRVRLGDVLSLHNNLSKRSRQNISTKANSRYLDFVLCDKSTLEIVAAIDLVNIRAENGHKQKKDWFLQGALDASRVPYIRIQIRNGYKPMEIRDCIYAKVNRPAKRNPIVRGTEVPAAMMRPRIPNKTSISTGLVQA